MWLTACVLVAEVTFLSVISDSLTKRIATILYALSRSKTVSISALTLILFPGTVIHELSHLFVAEILGVRTGKLTLAPEHISDEELQAGSVSIGHTDPFRRTLIGIAPFFIGLGVLSTLAYFFGQQFQPIFDAGRWPDLLNWKSIVTLGLYYYAIGTMSTSMFSSPEDLKGTLPVFLTLGLVIGGLWMAGIRLPVDRSVSDALSSILTSLSITLGVVLGINILTFIILTRLISILRRHR
mgnify:CR=1 FL=1